MTLVLGIHCNHDASVAICDGNRLIFSISEERLTNVKHYAGFPVKALERAFQYTGLDSKDIDCIAFTSHRVFFPEHKNSYLVSLDGSKTRVSLAHRERMRELIQAGKVYPEICSGQFVDRHWLNNKEVMYDLGLFRPHIRHYSITHHLAHASAAFRMSFLEAASVLTLDGVGDHISGTIYSGRPDGSLHLLRSSTSRNSLGAFYQAATDSLGFVPVDGEHKTMGLAAYFTNQSVSSFWKDFVITKDGVLKSIHKWRWKPYSPNFITLKSQNPLGSAVPLDIFRTFIDQYGKEWFAFHVQNNCQRTMCEYVHDGMRICGSNSICCAGGVFLNVRANLHIREQLDPENFFVLPDATDSGLSSGAAIETLFQERALCSEKISWSPYIGDSYTDQEVKYYLSSFANMPLSIRHLSPELVADEISKGKIVGTFIGRLEFGPRALGNRSLLADSRSIAVRERLRRMKKSEDFVPYAPVILDSDAYNYYDSPDDLRYMTFAVRASRIAIEKVPAVVHIDGTMRPQVVSATDNLWLYKVLIAFKQITGVGVLLNTSFNSHGKPIANSPEIAIKNLFGGIIDSLAIGQYLINIKS